MDQNTDTSKDENSKDDLRSRLKRQKTIPADSPKTQVPKARSQFPPEELVKYDYIFKKILAGNDMEDYMEVQEKDAKEHFPPIPFQFSVYDTNREQKRDFELVLNDGMYSFTMNWNVYGDDNQLEEDDLVIFYKMREDQIENSKLPHYAVKIIRAWDPTVNAPAPLSISLDEKDLEHYRAMMDMVGLARRK